MKAIEIEFTNRRLVREKDGRRVLYIRTTQDRFELPLAVADSPSELAKELGKTVGNVASSITHGRAGYFRIVMPEEDSLEMDLEDAKAGNLDAIKFLEERKNGRNNEE